MHKAYTVHLKISLKSIFASYHFDHFPFSTILNLVSN